ncbi:uncharacterized protein FOMMEDRAFT_127222 [Fomitiporia mediterranea MF3/22]|uniref:uncharacterized protein n=1 Tax=Fomitiporia mediterranea (strain MF3/22) TaxID=694068 RepID=UPI000440825F|nr:uncharacterized protein FOMMEDRAFT_127222 [Fomitiporia mediterranea MF3/22]EJD00565.1 hypothetical protein FOMMEDRAFT_127222 [Fomitiporia mediterranea MF3/22]
MSEDMSEGQAKQKAQASARRARERELSARRARGEISCAECRRLKLKCNKKVPCSSCIRRGCHTICPNGLLTTGQGSRFVLANTDKLHGKLLQMSERIRQLEDALQIAQSSISSAPHPLLSGKLLSVKSGVDSLSAEQDKTGEASEDEEEMFTAFGTLTVTEHGESRFIGRVAADNLLANEPNDGTSNQLNSVQSEELEIDLTLPDALIHAYRDFPFSRAHMPKIQLIALIIEYLPSYERATALAEAYLENLAWFPRPIAREQIMEDLIPFIYKGRRAQLPDDANDDGKYNGVHRMHTLALLLAVFACGAAADLTLRPLNREGQLYYYLSRAALGLHSMMEGGASLETVQTCSLLGSYDFFSCRKANMESTWKLASLSLVLAASIGLHRDPAHWDMEYRYMQRRRHVFWELYALDKWKSLGTGRPSIFHQQEVDCEFPEVDPAVGSDEDALNALFRWRQRFNKEIAAGLAEHLGMTRPIKFSEIMEFDRRIRDFADPPVPQTGPDGGPTDDPRFTLWLQHKQIALLFVHRNFFARAMIKYSANPLRSPFAPSFLAAYACSINILRCARLCYDQNPALVLRIWPLWTHCLTSGVILGSVASRVEQTQLANAALHDLKLAIAFFQKAGDTHPVAQQGLPVLTRLRDKATMALLSKLDDIGRSPSEAVKVKVEPNETEELRTLSGAPRLVRHKHKRKEDYVLGSPSQRSASDKSSTPKSNSASKESSPSPLLAMETSSSFTPASSFCMSAGVTDMTSPGEHEPVFSPSGQSLPSTQPAFTPAEQDIDMLLNMFYGKTSDSSNLSSAGFDCDPQIYGQPSGIPQVSSPTQFQQYSQGPMDPRTQTAFASGSSGMGNSPWLSDASQLGSMIAGAFGGQVPPYDAMVNAGKTSPAYDTDLVPGNDFGRRSEVSGDAAQFMADWQLQAALHGSIFPETGGDTTMSF